MIERTVLKISIIRNKTIFFGYLSAVLSAALFGSISTIAKPTLSTTINPVLLSSLVYLVAAIVMTPIAIKSHKSNTNIVNTQSVIEWKDYLYVVTIALFGAVIAPILYFVGLEKTSASHASVLSTGEILFTVIIALLFFDEHIKPIGYVGVILVLFAVFMIAMDYNSQIGNHIFRINYGDILIITATLFWATDNNISKIVSHKMSPAKIVQLKSIIGGSLLMAIDIGLGIKININLAQIPNIILLGAGGFAASIFFFLHSLKRIGTIKTILIFSTASIFGVIFSIAFLHEQLQTTLLYAIPVMLSGIYLISRKNSIIQF
jgi:drug/metabolite transporter (DMT)-like permease